MSPNFNSGNQLINAGFDGLANIGSNIKELGQQNIARSALIQKEQEQAAANTFIQGILGAGNQQQLQEAGADQSLMGAGANTADLAKLFQGQQTFLNRQVNDGINNQYRQAATKSVNIDNEVGAMKIPFVQALQEGQLQKLTLGNQALGLGNEATAKQNEYIRPLNDEKIDSSRAERKLARDKYNRGVKEFGILQKQSKASGGGGSGGGGGIGNSKDFGNNYQQTIADMATLKAAGKEPTEALFVNSFLSRIPKGSDTSHVQKIASAYFGDKNKGKSGDKATLNTLVSQKDGLNSYNKAVFTGLANLSAGQKVTHNGKEYTLTKSQAKSIHTKAVNKATKALDYNLYQSDQSSAKSDIFGDVFNGVTPNFDPKKGDGNPVIKSIIDEVNRSKKKFISKRQG